jgi:integrase
MECPRCGSRRLYRDGLRYLSDGASVQRWLCRNCGYRFADPTLKNPKREWKNSPFSLNLESSLNNSCQGNDDPVGRDSTSLGMLVKTLATVEKEEAKSGHAGDTETTQSQPDVKGALIQFMWWLKKQGYSDETVKTRVKFLKCFVKNGVNIYDPEAVKEGICRKDEWSAGYKELAVESYSSFLAMIGKTWNPPRYKRVPKLPFIPTETELETLIACFNASMEALLLLLKETGARLGEAVNLEWRDIDFEAGTVRITPEKGSNPRVFRANNRLLSMLKRLQTKAKGVKVFPSKSCVEAYFYRKRKQIAAKLCNPRILQISFHTFRHWKATMEYAKTKDILHVMKLLGHRNIQNTLVYTQLVNFESDEYVCKASRDSVEAAQLIESGFEYVCTTPEGVMLFRKRK